MKVEFTFPDEISEKVIDLSRRFGGDTRHMFNVSLTLLETYIREHDSGNLIAIVNETAGTYQALKIELDKPKDNSNEYSSK